MSVTLVDVEVTRKKFLEELALWKTHGIASRALYLLQMQ